MIIIKLEAEGKIDLVIDNKTFTLELEDFEISTKDIPGWTVASNSTLTVALDLHLSEELINEGIVRELVNRVQNLRKDSGLEVTDKIKLLLKNDEPIVKAVEENKDYLTSETLTTALEILDAIENILQELMVSIQDLGVGMGQSESMEGLLAPVFGLLQKTMSGDESTLKLTSNASILSGGNAVCDVQSAKVQNAAIVAVDSSKLLDDLEQTIKAGELTFGRMKIVSGNAFSNVAGDVDVSGAMVV